MYLAVSLREMGPSIARREWHAERLLNIPMDEKRHCVRCAPDKQPRLHVMR